MSTFEKEAAQPDSKLEKFSNASRKLAGTVVRVFAEASLYANNMKEAEQEAARIEKALELEYAQLGIALSSGAASSDFVDAASFKEHNLS